MTVSRWRWGALVAVIALVGLTARLWNLDFDARQHQHPDERHWALTSATLGEAPAPAAHGTLLGPLLDWMDGDRSPANVYRGTEHFQYGPVTLALARDAAGWLHDGVEQGDQPAALVADALDALGVDLVDDTGHARFDAGYQVDLVGRLLGALFDTLTIVVVALIGRRVSGRRVGLVAAGFYAASVMAIQHAHFLGAEPLVGLAAAGTVLATLRIDRTGEPRAWRGGLLAGLAAGAALAAKLSAISVALVPVVLCAWLVVRHRRPADWFRLAAVLVGAVIAFRVLNPGAFEGLGMRLKRPFLDDVHDILHLTESDIPPTVQWARRSGVADGVRWMVQFTVGPGTVLAAVVGSVALWRRRATTGSWVVATLLGVVLATSAVVYSSFAFFGRYLFSMLPAIAVLAGYGAVALWEWRPAVPRLAHAGRVAASALVGAAALWAVVFVGGVYGQTNTRVAASRWIAEHVPTGAVVSTESWDDGLPLRLPGIDPAQWTYKTFELWDTDSTGKIDTLATQLAQVDYVVESSPRVWNAVVRIPARYPVTIAFFHALDAGTLGFDRVATFASPLPDAAAEEAFSVYDHPEVRIWRKVTTLDHAQLLAALNPWPAATAVHVTPQGAAANGLVQLPDEHAAAADAGTYDQAFDTTGSPWLHLLGWLALLAMSAVAAFVLCLPLLRRLPDAGAGVAPLLGLAAPAVVVFVIVAWGQVVFTRGLVIAVYLLWLGAGAIVAHRRWPEVCHVWRRRRGLILTVITVTLVTFALGVALRAADPDLWHPTRAGEKPFELTMLTEVMRTRSLPPHDAWISGGTLNYYYVGYLMLSLPARLLRTSPTVVMNLALAVFSACTSAAAVGLGAAVRARTRRRSPRDLRRAGLLAAALVFVPNPQAVIDALRWLRGGHGTFDWWAPSRVVGNSQAITEFPSWSLLFGDVHPHVLDLAVLLAVFTMSLAWYLAAAHRRRSWVHALAVGVLVGMVRATNTWDFPLAAATAAAVPVTVFLRTHRWRTAARDLALAAGVALVLWLPYTQRIEVYDAGTDPVAHRTHWLDWASHWGFFAVVTLVVVAPAGWRWVRRQPLTSVGWVLMAGGVVLALHDRSVQVTCIALAAVAAVAAVRGGRGVSRLGLAVTSVGWLALALIEQVSVQHDFDRQNTVFKGWYQAWLLLAVASAVCLVTMLPALGSRPARRGVRSLVGVALAGALVFAFVGVPARVDQRTSTGGWSLDGEAFFADDPAVADDLPLIEWLRANVRGLVVVAEAPGDDYRWSARVAQYVGLPTPIGWPYHERQQRRPYGQQIDRRIADLTELYTTTDPLRVDQILATYDARYVVFGVVERQLTDAVTGGRTLLAASCTQEVFRSGELFIAAVDPTCLRSVPLPG